MDILKQNNKGALIVISGPSGAGKDTVVENYLQKHDNAWLSISCTTRKMRPNDIEGGTYYFLDEEEFVNMINNNEFLEYARYNDNYYGTPKKYIEEKLKNGIDVFLVVEVNGAKKIKEIFKDAICIFIMPPSMKELKKRLVDRKTENFDKLLERFKMAYQEINNVTNYNYVIVNDKIENAVLKIESIIIASKCDVSRIEKLFLDNKEEEIHELLMEKDFINKDIEI